MDLGRIVQRRGPSVRIRVRPTCPLAVSLSMVAGELAVHPFLWYTIAREQDDLPENLRFNEEIPCQAKTHS